jgi:hypothetical protein
MRLKLLRLVGWVYNLAGLPGFVRDCEYTASVTKATVTVRHSSLFTVININGLDVYFTRLTGTIDGVGSTPASDYRPCESPKGGRSAA